MIIPALKHLLRINAILLFWFALNAPIQAQSVLGEARVYSTQDSASMPYRLFIPKDLDKNSSYPLVLCFHGAAGRGTDNMTRGSLSYQVLTTDSMQLKNPAFIVAPQCPKGARWVNHDWKKGAYDSKTISISKEMTLALAIVDALVEEFNIDTSRIYVTGRSMGGFATWDAIARRPDFFAAAVPIAGGGDPGCAESWKNLPIWTVASVGDQLCPVEGTRVVVEALEKVGAPIKYTEDPEKDHGQICQAWASLEGLGDWLFAQRKWK